MNNDLISRSELINARPVFMNEEVVRDTKYRTAKDRIYAKAWNACNSYWLNIIDNAPTVSLQDIYQEGYYDGHLEGYTKAINEKRPHGEWSDESKDSLLCSACGNRVYKPFIGGFPTERTSHYYPNFCAFCGADMRKGEEE